MLHIIYRSYGGENMKRRPLYYSKLLALCSLLRTWEKVRSENAELIFLNDGPIPPERLKLMKAAGEVVSKSNMGNKGSIEAALGMPMQRKWADDDLVWFAEDDYLYLPNALSDLRMAAESAPDFDYFGLYALIGNRQPNGKPHIDCRVPENWRDSDEKVINGHVWRAALSTTSTFGARVRAVRSDRGMMLLAMRTGGAFDHTTCLAYQGFHPFPNRFLIESFQQAKGIGGSVRAALLAAMRWTYGLYFIWWQRRAAPRKLFAADPALISHMEIDNLALGTDWEKVAEEARIWASQSHGVRATESLP
jgi:hypothetical protein